MDINELLTSKTYVLKKDQILFEPGASADAIFLLTKGKIDLLKIHNNGSTVGKTIEAGMTLGELEYFTKTKYKEQAKVREETTVIIIEEDVMDLFIEAFPQFVLQMLKRLSANLKQTNEELEMAISQSRVGEGVERKGNINIVEVEKYYQIEGTKKYPMLLPENHDEFLYLKEVECPICECSFSVNQIRSSKLVLDKTDKDLRRRYKNFDELWYQLWRCPCCGYTNFHNEFFKITPNTKKTLFESLPRKSIVGEIRLIKRDINQVLEDYFHLNKLIAFYNVDSVVKVRLWQSIAWLLADVKDDELAYKARRVLKVMIEDSWYNSRVITQQEDEIKLTLKLAMLCKEEGEYRQARKYLLTLSQIKTMPVQIRNIIQDEVLLLKELSKSEAGE
jgi:hypothetical protein